VPNTSGGSESSAGAGSAEDNGGGAGAQTDLPALTLEPMGEITLAGFTGSPEDLVVDQGGITIVTLEGSLRFSLEGASGQDERNPQRAGMGADAFGNQWFATVRGSVLTWADFELTIDQLEGAMSATGLAVDMDETGDFQRVYVTDSVTSKIEEYTSQGGALRELVVPGADLQGIAFSPTRRLFALDARRRRLVRANESFSAIDAAVPVPNPGGEPSGIHWFESRLYVCFRDSSRVAFFRLDDGT
jgi:hypothetical protein